MASEYKSLWPSPANPVDVDSLTAEDEEVNAYE
eukprot:CAMPEP_0197414842 /NCGR_PEP_ID=MMETSP1170-20131217/1506_1 /TAXON_ID=54406 /ORGANISM="Sarcinochrysis sp, Strain CCMP770" /LENGTH=32 /DNA_ID= /DNA_START= /DNA_END= /DNA_ORIENTATION=